MGLCFSHKSTTNKEINMVINIQPNKDTYTNNKATEVTKKLNNKIEQENKSENKIFDSHIKKHYIKHLLQLLKVR